ncbi:MAG: response regulator [Ignavibacteriales bacterium]|nr:response regulator [Ignavibacteriales bacterium]
MNILIVDDEPEYRMLLGHFLEGEGHTVFLAEHGEDGLKKLDDAELDLIISDVYMPKMDGLKFYKHVRASVRHQKIPFLFVSGFDDQHTTSAVKSSNLDGFCRKARPLSELNAWIKYLTTPINKRPLTPPGFIPDRTEKDRKRDRSLRSNR